MQKFLLSQFLHGEQGALICTGLITAYGAVDRREVLRGDAGHGRSAPRRSVRALYAEEKLGGTYPINANLGRLLDNIVADNRWDITYLGMQIMVEGSASRPLGSCMR